MEGKVFVAVPQEFEAGIRNLKWVLRNIQSNAKIVITHVHRPAQMINLGATMLPASNLDSQQVYAFRQVERKHMQKSLNDYRDSCLKVTAKVEMLVIEKDNVAKGLVELVAKHGITKLVMGAAADEHYSKEMKAPSSKKARNIKEKADISCQIWFLCKGNLICTRLSTKGSPSTLSSPSVRKSKEDLQSFPHSHPELKRGKDKEKGGINGAGRGHVVLKVELDCEGCTQDAQKFLKIFKGVEKMTPDLARNALTVEGNVDPSKLKKELKAKLNKTVNVITLTGRSKKDTPVASRNAKPAPTTLVLKVRETIKIREAILEVKGVEKVTMDAAMVRKLLVPLSESGGGANKKVHGKGKK